jgi:hypothetical protein
MLKDPLVQVTDILLQESLLVVIYPLFLFPFPLPLLTSNNLKFTNNGKTKIITDKLMTFDPSLRDH